MGSTATIDATRGERVGMAVEDRHIEMQHGAVVHGALTWQDHRGSWWALGDNSHLMFSTSCDDLLTQIAEATGASTDLDDLRGRLGRAIERADRQRAEDALTTRAGNRPPKTHRCSQCGGSGRIHQGAGTVKCPGCGGSGVVKN